MSEKKVNYISRMELVSEIVKKDAEGFIYTKSIGYEYEYIGFWMRMYGEHFRPCQKCQLELLKLLKTSPLNFTMETMHVTFHQQIVNEEGTERYFEFGLPFIVAVNQHWKPCPTCQKEVLEIVQTVKSLHIGNKEYSYPIELYKEYDIDDKSWKIVEKRKPTKEEINNPELRID